AISGILFFWQGPLLWLAALLAWLAPFIYVVAAHRRLDAAIRRHQLWLDIKRAHLSRMALDWAGLPPPATLPPPPQDHPFANDLDLSGERSLHHLVDTAVTFDGSERLRQRLLDREPSLPEVQRRQVLVHALRPLTLFRDRLALQALLARQESNKPWQADA